MHVRVCYLKFAFCTNVSCKLISKLCYMTVTCIADKYVSVLSNR